jgi:hypothetical protein
MGVTASHGGRWRTLTALVRARTEWFVSTGVVIGGLRQACGVPSHPVEPCAPERRGGGGRGSAGVGAAQVGVTGAAFAGALLGAALFMLVLRRRGEL